MKKPPEGFAYAYVTPTGIVTYRGPSPYGHVWHDDTYNYFADCLENPNADIGLEGVRIYDLEGIDRDNPPTYAMAPSPMGVNQSAWVRADGHISYGRRTTAGFAGPSVVAKYDRHERFPEILVLVSQPREIGDVIWGAVFPPKISDVIWGDVHSGDSVPPAKVVPPEFPITEQHTGFAVLSRGEAIPQFGGVEGYTLQREITAHYSRDGHLLAHRTKDGWHEVPADRTAPPPKPEREENTDAAGPAKCRHGISHPTCGYCSNQMTCSDRDAPAFDARAYAERKERERQSWNSRIAWGNGPWSSAMVRDREQERLAKERGERDRKLRDAGL